MYLDLWINTYVIGRQNENDNAKCLIIAREEWRDSAVVCLDNKLRNTRAENVGNVITAESLQGYHLLIM